MNSNHRAGTVSSLGHGNFAYIQEGGSWGWSNAGLVTSEGESLLIDTLFDLNLTGAMLEAFADASSAASRIGTLVNTHNDGDHTHGNQLLPGARIIASDAAAEAMAAGVQPEEYAQMLANADDMGDLGAFLKESFGDFSFAGFSLRLPTETFTGEMAVPVGAKQVELIQYSSHTPGDVLVHVPEDRTVFTGDLVFNGSHPVIWAGPPSRWVEALDLILGWDPEHIVPGHGQLASRDDVLRLREYFVELIELGGELRSRGLTPVEAARYVLEKGKWPAWGEWERLVVNFDAVYQQLGDAPTFANQMEGLTAMAQFYAACTQGGGQA